MIPIPPSKRKTSTIYVRLPGSVKKRAESAALARGEHVAPWVLSLILREIEGSEKKDHHQDD